jgi:probable licABCH operon transcriptional regulator
VDTKLEKILNEISQKDYQTAQEIANRLQVSEKTVRIRMKELNDILVTHGAEILSKQRYGYKLKVLDVNKFKKYVESLQSKDKEQLPTTSAERVPFILAFLLNREDYIKLDDLSDFLYVSRNTLTADLKKVEFILNIYHLSLERRPNYGLRVEGKEFNKRICIANSLVKRNHFFKEDVKKEQDLQNLGDIVMEILNKYKMRISEISFESLITHAYIAIGRISRNCPIIIDKKKINTLIEEKAMQAARDIANQINKKLSVEFSEEEVFYLAIHMGAKLSSDSYVKHGSNLVISGEIDELVLQMLNAVFHGFKIDFRNNLELRMALNQHMVPFDIRMKYQIPLKNPFITEIKKEYALAYTVAATACTALNEYYKIVMPEDEIGYFAILFALALEKQDKKIEKKNIVVVCVSGKGSAQLFMYKYKQAFGKYINQIYECSVYELAEFDFKGRDIDYVFTTIPINMKIPVPVFEVNLFLEHKDILTYNELFETGNNEFLHKYYRRELFVTKVEGNEKEDIIKQLCEHAQKYYNLPEGFYEAVIKREQLGQTDFGNMTAIPHPYKVITKENFVAVGILNEPIWWGHNEVQVVFLISISTEEDADIERFYQLTTSLLFHAQKIQYLIQHPTFEVLMLLLNDVKEMNGLIE